MSNPVAFVSSLADRCGVRPLAGSNVANAQHVTPNGGLYGQLKLTASVHGSKVSHQCTSRASLITHTYTELLDDVNKVGAFLASINVPERSVCLFLSRPSYPMIASYIGAVAANCAPAILYEDAADADVLHIASDSGAAVIFIASQPVSDRSPQQLPDKFVQAILPKLPRCKHVVLLPSDSLADPGVMQKLQAEANLLASKFSSKSVSPGEERRSCSFHSWADFAALGASAHQSALAARASNVHADSCCCVCYGTSASRSRPVGSMLSHDNVLWTARVFAENYLRLQAGDVIAATLPLALALSQVVYIAAAIQAAAVLCFPRALKAPYDVSLAFLVETQPHIVLCTPLQLKTLISEIEKLPTVAHAAQSSKTIALDGGRAAAMGQSKPRFYGWNRRRVFSKIWAVSGLARCTFLGSCGDVCPQLLAERYMAIGLCVCNVYGCNEATGLIAATKNDPARRQLPLANEWKFGMVGRSVPGCQIRLVVGAQQPGKLLFAGRNTFMGYLNRGAASSADGFVDSGDWAFSDSSFIGIEGRDSDRIVLSTGAAVHAAHVQAAIEQGLPGTQRAVLFGHGMAHLSVICEFEQGPSNGSLSEACISWQRATFSDVAHVQVSVSGALGSEVFKRQVAVALYEMQTAGKFRGAGIAKVSFVKDRLSVEEEDVVPGGRNACRRDRIMKRFAKQICDMYPGAAPSAVESGVAAVYLAADQQAAAAPTAAAPASDLSTAAPAADSSTAAPVAASTAAAPAADSSTAAPAAASTAAAPAADSSTAAPAAASTAAAPAAASTVAAPAAASTAAAPAAASTAAAPATESTAAAPAADSSAAAPAAASSASAIPASAKLADVDSAGPTVAHSAPQSLQGQAADASITPPSAPAPPGTLCELPDGTKVDLSDVERRLEAASPILSRAVVYHLPGQTYFVSMLALRTQAWQSVPPNVGLSVSGGGLSHHLLHEDVIAAIAARGSSAMTTMEAKNDKIVRAMLTDALKKVNESAPRDANGSKQGVVLKYVIVPTGLGLVDDEKLPGGFVNRARVIEKYKSSVNQMYNAAAVATAASVSPSVAPPPKDAGAASSGPTNSEQSAVLPNRAAVVDSRENVRAADPAAPDNAPPSIAGSAENSAPVSGESSAAAAAVPLPREDSSAAAAPQANASLAPGTQCGVGVYLKLAQEGFVEVKATEPGCSADGLLFVGDIVTAVDSSSCVGMSVKDITRLIVGEEGSCVTISVMREFAVSPTSTKTFMREVPVLLTRRPLPQQRSSRAVKALSESSLQTPRGEAQPLHAANGGAARDVHVGSYESSSLPPLEDSGPGAAAHSASGEAPMRQFFVSNVGLLPLKLSVYDCDDVLRVTELVVPQSQYPLEHNTYLPLPSGQRVRIVLQSGLSEFYLQLGAFDRFQHCFLCAAADSTGIQAKPLYDVNGREIEGNLNARQLHANSATST